MAHDAEHVSLQLVKLAPRGALARGLPSRLRSLWIAIADELVRVYGRAADLIREAHPSTTDELLPDWEDEYGLPDPCVTIAQTEDDRRASLVARFVTAEAVTRQYFIDLAESMGITVEIVEHSAFQVGRNGMGDGVGGNEWASTWEVRAPAATPDALKQSMECVFQSYNPAHLLLFFTYI